MRRLPPSRLLALLGLVLLVGTLARAPGLFWGYDVFGTDRVIIHPDEPPYTFGHDPATDFPRGFAANVGVVARLLAAAGVPEVARYGRYDLVVGRGLSLLYGLLTLLVVFRVSRALFGDDRIALLAAFFLALGNLHVTYSHIGIPEAAATFWFWAALAAAHGALARGSRAAAAVSAACSGVAGAMRYQFLSLLPLGVWVVRAPGRLGRALLVVGAALAAFYVVNDGRVDPRAVWRFAHLVVPGTLGPWAPLVLPPVYLAVLLVGVGLPVFLLAGYGVVRLARDWWRAPGGWRAALRDPRLPILLAPVAAFLQASTVGLWTPRHVTVVTPLVAMLAAWGFVRLPVRPVGRLSAGVVRGALLGLIGAYLAVYVASVQAHFVDDPLEKAGRWLRAHVPAGVVLSVFGAEVPPEYPRIEDWDGSYLVLSARRYGRYFFDGLLPSALTGRLPAAHEVHRGTPENAERLRKLAQGELPYRLVKRFRPRFHTPETALSQAYWYPLPHIHEVLIYERARGREVRARLLTPTRTDYLLTLDTGPLWRPPPGQAVRLSVNGRPLEAGLTAGLNQVRLPREAVVSPYSELRLDSPEPLPHLPPELVARVRPIGPEFGVEALLDGDLMAEGFSSPEVAADGAAWRWTDGAGRVLLPRPGAGAPWRRVAARLQGPDGAGPVTAVLLLDGRPVGEVAVGAEPRVVDLALPAWPSAADVVPLEILSPVRRGGAADGGRRGVAVFWVAVTRRADVRRAHPDAAAVGAAATSWRPRLGLGVDHRREAVSFPSGRLTLRADLFHPPGRPAGVVVLAHGASPLGRRHGLYLGLARRLAERGYLVLSPDLRGYGESEDPARVASAADLDFAADLVAATDYLQERFGPTRVTVVGHSFGGGVAVAAAARDPRVAGVVAVSPGRRAYEVVLGTAEQRRQIRDRMVGEMGLRPEQFPVELVDAVVVPIIVDSYVDRPFRAPVLFVDGALEDAADLRFLHALSRRMQAATAYVTIPRADHYFGVQREVEERDPVVLERLAEVVDGWIREGERWERAR